MRKRWFPLVVLVAFALGLAGCPRPQTLPPPTDNGPVPAPGPPPTPSVSKLLIRGFLAYRSGGGKRFFWNLRFYEETGLVIGNGRDRDGYAEFFGTFNRNSRRLYMVKFFKYRRSGRKRFFYKGFIRGGRLLGTAHLGSHWGPKYAGWAGQVSFRRLAFTQGQPKRFVLQGVLRYFNGRGKRFYWKLSYFPSSGVCFGVVSDRDGRATFDGVYDRPTHRFFLRKRYPDGRTFYYRGRMLRNGVYGNARKYSFTSRKIYGRWAARMLYRLR